MGGELFSHVRHTVPDHEIYPSISTVAAAFFRKPRALKDSSFAFRDVEPEADLLEFLSFLGLVLARDREGGVDAVGLDRVAPPFQTDILHGWAV